MSVVAILLRLALSATLVLNGGSGWAMSSSHPDQDGAGHDATPIAEFPPSETIVLELPCHTGEELPAVTALEPSNGGSILSDDGPTDSANDCCELGVCDCGCLHQGGLAFAAVFVRLPDTHDPQSPVAFAHEHAAPMLANLMRPPIA